VFRDISLRNLLPADLTSCNEMIYGTELMSRKIDVDDKGSLDKAAVIAALGQSGDADYDSVSLSLATFLSP
jgi:hypothetical protein